MVDERSYETGGIPFPLQISNFESTAAQEQQLLDSLPDAHNPDIKFIRYENTRMRCRDFVGDRVGVFQTPPHPHAHVRGPGLMHQMTNLKALLTEAKALGRVAVVEYIPFDSKHNNNRFVCAPWSRYLDMSLINRSVPIWPGWNRLALRLRGRDEDRVEYFTEFDRFDKLNGSEAKVVVRSFGPTMAEYQALHRGDYWRVQQEVLEVLVESRFVTKMAELGIRKMLKEKRNYVCVKVRRGDKLKEKGKYPCLDECTQSKRVLQKLRNHQVSMKKEAVFLMTNEMDRAFFKPLMRSGYLVETSETLGLLENVEIQTDNFMQFAVEIAICRRARGMIGTIHEKFEHIGHNLQPFEFRDRLTPYRKSCDARTKEGRIYLPECRNACELCTKD